MANMTREERVAFMLEMHAESGAKAATEYFDSLARQLDSMARDISNYRKAAEQAIRAGQYGEARSRVEWAANSMRRGMSEAQAEQAIRDLTTAQAFHGVLKHFGAED